mgnify:CR=1 FL=1
MIIQVSTEVLKKFGIQDFDDNRSFSRKDLDKLNTVETIQELVPELKDYYINNNDNIIKKKFKLIIDNQEYINNLFLLWKNHINLKKYSSCIYILK